MGALLIARQDGPTERTRHLDIRYHFVQQHIQLQDIYVEHIGTADQLADILTKGLQTSTHHRLLSEILQ